MVDIYGRSSRTKEKKEDIDLSKYATKDEIDNLLTLTGIDQDEVVIFQDRHGKLKTSNIKWNDIIRRVLGATADNIVGFTDSGRIRDSLISIAALRDDAQKAARERVAKTGDTMTGELSMNGNKITVLANPEGPEDAANKQYIDTSTSAIDGKLTTLRAEYDVHVGAFTRLRRNFAKTDEAVNTMLVICPGVTPVGI